MSSPLLFFIVVIVIDLILKSVRDKRKIERGKEKRQRDLLNQPDFNKEKPIKEQGSIRELMSTLREEVEKERLKEIERRRNRPIEREVSKVNIEKTPKKVYEDKKRRRRYEEPKREMPHKIEVEIIEEDNKLREDLVRGIIFSEILSEPKSIQNRKRSI